MYSLFVYIQKLCYSIIYNGSFPDPYKQNLEHLKKNYVVYWVNNGSTKIEVDTSKKYKVIFFDEHAVKIEAVN